MAWNKFTHLSTLSRLDQQVPSVKESRAGIRRQELSADAAQRADMLAFLAQVPISREDAGAVAEKPAIVSRFMQTQLNRKRNERTDTTDWLPGWVREMVERQASSEEVVRTMTERLLRAPSEQAFLEAEIVINELGRDAEGSALLKRYLSEEFKQKLARMMKS